MSAGKSKQKETTKMIQKKNGLTKKPLTKSENFNHDSKCFVDNYDLANPSDFEVCQLCPNPILR